MVDQPAPQSPEWWLRKLHKVIEDRAQDIKKFDNYYLGDHPLPTVPEKARESFRRLLKLSRANFTGLVVDATAERMQVDGFRFGEDRIGDKAAWNIWQFNGLDAGSELVLTDATSLKAGYLLIWPNAANRDLPFVTVEHISQVAIATAPGNRRLRLAALKLWVDDWTGKLMATLYMPTVAYKYVSEKKANDTGYTAETVKWVPREVQGEPWPLPHPFKVPPMVELPNRPHTIKGPRSEIDDVTDIQDRINKTIADRLMTQEYGAFRQKWATGFEIPEDDDGNAVEPFDVAVNRLLINAEKEARFGTFEESPLEPYIAGAESDIFAMSSITKTPPHYLLNRSGQPVSGDALKAAEAGLIAKVRKRMRHHGEGFEEAMRLAFMAAGDTARATDYGAETIWRNPEFRTEGELVDSLTKMGSLGVPEEALWERWGATQAEIERWKGMAEDEAKRKAAALGVADLLVDKPDPTAE